MRASHAADREVLVRARGPVSQVLRAFAEILDHPPSARRWFAFDDGILPLLRFRAQRTRPLGRSIHAPFVGYRDSPGDTVEALFGVRTLYGASS